MHGVCASPPYSIQSYRVSSNAFDQIERINFDCSVRSDDEWMNWCIGVSDALRNIRLFSNADGSRPRICGVCKACTHLAKRAASAISNTSPALRKTKKEKKLTESSDCVAKGQLHAFAVSAMTFHNPSIGYPATGQRSSVIGSSNFHE